MTSEFKKYIAPMGSNRLFGMSPQDFLDTMPERRWTRRAELMTSLKDEGYKGITTDGSVIPDLYELRDEGAPTEAILNAVDHLLASLTPEQKANTLLPLDSIEKHGWHNGIPDFGSHGFRLDQVPPQVREAAPASVRKAMSAPAMS